MRAKVAVTVCVVALLATVGARVARALGLWVPDAQVVWPAGVGVVEIPFEHTLGLIVVAVSINGSEPLRFALDTGAPVTVVLRNSLSDSLDIDIVGRTRVGGVGSGEATTARLGRADARFGDLVLRGVTTVSGVGAELLPDLDGIIGAALFGNAVVELDWESSVVRAWRPDAFVYDGPGATLDLRIASNGHPWVSGIRIDTGDGAWRDASLRLDSGARWAIALNTGGPFGVPETAVPGIVAWGTQGPAEGHWGRVARVRLGTMELRDVVTGFRAADPVGSSAGVDSDGVVGLRVLERFTSWIDFPGGRLILEPNSSFGDSFPFDVTGIRFAPHASFASVLVVAYVADGSPAAETGVRPGDRVRRLGGRSVDELSVDDVNALLEGSPGRFLTLSIERAGALEQVTLATRPLI